MYNCAIKPKTMQNDNLQTRIKYQNDASMKCLLPKYTNSSYNSIARNKQPNKKWTEILNRHISKEDTDGRQAQEKMLNLANRVMYSEL